MDEALLILNDQCGKDVEVSVDCLRSASPINSRGVLHHWRSQNEAWADHSREDIRGLYYVGDIGVDVTDLEVVEPRDHDGSMIGLRFHLGDDVSMTVTWSVDS